MLKQKKNGWFWHIRLYNYLTGEKNCYNSEKPFATYDECFDDLIKFLKKKKKEAKSPK